MSIHDSLLQSIAALDRLTSVDSEYLSEKTNSASASAAPLLDHYGDRRLHHAGQDCPSALDDEKASFASPTRPKVDTHMECEDAPVKSKLKYLLSAVYRVVAVLLPFANLALGAAILISAADNIAWWNSIDDMYIVTNWFAFGYDDNNQYATKMRYKPLNYELGSIHGLFAAGLVCTLGGVIVTTLSTIHWRTGQSRRVKLGKKREPWPPIPICIILDTCMFATSLNVLISIRRLFNPRQDGIDAYYTSLSPGRFTPPILIGYTERAVDYLDETVRFWDSEHVYSVISWNCHMDWNLWGEPHHRVGDLCREGRAAPQLLIALVVLTALMLMSHVVTWWSERKASLAWTRQSIECEMASAPPARREREDVA